MFEFIIEGVKREPAIILVAIHLLIFMVVLWFLARDGNNNKVSKGSMDYVPSKVEDDDVSTVVPERLTPSEARQRANKLYQIMSMRSSCRFFASDPVPNDIIETCILTAATAPAYAQTQPWSFVTVADPAIKRKIRQAIEDQEQLDIAARKEKHGDSEPIKTMDKNYIEEAHCLIIILKQALVVRGIRPDQREYIFGEESCAIAAGFLIAALHNANLATMISTSVRADTKIREILHRGDSERVYMILPVGYPHKDVKIPARPSDVYKKNPEKIIAWSM